MPSPTSQYTLARTRGFTDAGIAQIPDDVNSDLARSGSLSAEQERIADESIARAKEQLRELVFENMRDA